MKDMKPLRTGIIGCGAISDIYFENLTQKFRIVDVVKCASKGGESAVAKGEKYHVKSCTVEEIIKDPEIELVVNLTPAPQHGTLIRQALEAGKHVYTEKVITPTVEEAVQLVELAREKGLYLCCAPDHFMGSTWQCARELIDKGMLGEITSLYASVGQDMNVLLDRLGFVNEPAGGIGLDFGIYLMTAAVSLLGPVDQVCGIVETKCPRRVHKEITHPEFGQEYDSHNEDMVMGTLKFASGAIGSIHLNGNTITSAPPMFYVYGTEGVLSLPNPGMFSGEIKLFRSGSFEPVVQIPVHGLPHNSRGAGVAEMAWAIRGSRKARADASMGLHCLEALMGLKISSQTGSFYQVGTTCERPRPLAGGFRGMEVFSFDQEGALV